MGHGVVIIGGESLNNGLLLEKFSALGDTPDVAFSAGFSAGVRLIQKLNPDVVVLDCIQSKGDISDSIRRILANCSSAYVIVIGPDNDAEMEYRAATSGARAYVRQSQVAKELAPLVHLVSQGQLHFSHAVMQRLLSQVPALLRKLRLIQGPLGQLTERERKVLICLARGLSNPKIAQQIFCSLGTVKADVQNILRKLKLPNRTEAAVFAVKEGLLESSDD